MDWVPRPGFRKNFRFRSMRSHGRLYGGRGGGGARTGLCFWKISLAGRGENGNGLRSWRLEGWLRVLLSSGPEGGGLAQAGEGEQWVALRGTRKENELDLGPHGRW